MFKTKLRRKNNLKPFSGFCRFKGRIRGERIKGRKKIIGEKVQVRVEDEDEMQKRVNFLYFKKLLKRGIFTNQNV